MKKKYTTSKKNQALVISLLLINLIYAPLSAQELYLDAENASIENSANGNIMDNGRTLIGANRIGTKLGPKENRPFFSNIARAGKKSVAYQLNKKTSNSSQRIETAIVHHSKREGISNGTEKYTGFSFQLDKNIWQNPKRWFVIHQIQQSESKSQTGNFPIIALHIEENTNNRLSLKSRSGINGDVDKITAIETTLDIIDIEKGIWYDVVVGWKFRPNNTDGWTAVWIKKSTENNYKEYKKRNIKVGYSDPPKEIFQNKIGQYRGAQDTQNRLYFDEVRYATSLNKAQIPNSTAPTTPPVTPPTKPNTKNKAPKASFKSLKNGNTFKIGASLKPVINANDEDGSITKVLLYLNNKLVRQENSNPYEWGHIADKDGALKNLPKGSYTLKAVATDNNGANGEATVSITVGENTSTITPPTNEQVIANGVYILKNPNNNQLLASNKSINYNAQMDNNKNSTDQQWLFIYLGNNTYSIKNNSTNRYLEVPFGLCENGANITSYTNGKLDHQKWKVEKNGTYYALKPLHCTSKALDRSAGANFANLHLWASSTTNNNQKWEITGIGSAKAISTDPFISIYPNPASSNESVIIDGTTVGASIQIFNTLGQVVKQVTATSTKEEISLTGLGTGIYFINSNNEAVLKLIIK